MLWNVLFWLALAYLAGMALTRFIIPAFGQKSKKAESDSSSILFTWVLPVMALLVMAGSFYMKTQPQLFHKTWSDEEREELLAFSESLAWYDQAQQIYAAGDMTMEEWESVRAFLGTSLDKLDEVNSNTLFKISPELSTRVQREFRPGLSAGLYGLQYYTMGRLKSADTVRTTMVDSLNIGREMLASWNTWYEEYRGDILAELPAAS